MEKYSCQLCCGVGGDGDLELLSETLLGAALSRAVEVGSMVSE